MVIQNNTHGKTDLNGVTESMTARIARLHKAGLSLYAIKAALEKDGIKREIHYIRNVVFRLRIRAGEIKPAHVVRQPELVTAGETAGTQYDYTAGEFKDLIPTCNGYIDTDGNGERIIKAFRFNQTAGDKERINFVLVGETGTGKTQLGYYAGYKLKLPVFNATFNGETDTAQLFGAKELIKDDSGQTRVIWKDGIITQAVRHGGILLLDEFNAVTPQIAFSLFSLFSKTRDLILYDNNGERIKAHNNLMIICTQNEGVNYAGINEQNAALLGRCIFLKIDYNEKTEKQLVKTGDILNNNLITFASKQRDAYRIEKYSMPISTRDLIQITTLIKIYGETDALNIFLNKFRNESEKISIRGLYELEVLRKNDNTNTAAKI